MMRRTNSSRFRSSMLIGSPTSCTLLKDICAAPSPASSVLVFSSLYTRGEIECVIISAPSSRWQSPRSCLESERPPSGRTVPALPRYRLLLLHYLLQHLELLLLLLLLPCLPLLVRVFAGLRQLLPVAYRFVAQCRLNHCLPEPTPTPHLSCLDRILAILSMLSRSFVEMKSRR